MAKNSVVVMRQWLEQFREICNEEQQKEICYNILEYGLFGNKIESADAGVQLAMNFILPQIDAMQASYGKKVESAKKAGRPSTIDKFAVWKLARKGLTAAQIASELGVANYRSIYENDGWKCRKIENFQEIGQEIV